MHLCYLGREMSRTANQTAIFDEFWNSREAEVFRLLTFAKRANDAVVSLPRQNDAGESVTHRENREMLAIRDVYMSMAQSIRPQLDRSTEDRLATQFNLNWSTNRFSEK